MSKWDQRFNPNHFFIYLLLLFLFPKSVQLSKPLKLSINYNRLIVTLLTLYFQSNAEFHFFVKKVVWMDSAFILIYKGVNAISGKSKVM
jgi:hypothetical protein